MKFPVSGGGDFKRAPAGSHVAVCNLVVDVGIQPGRGQFPNPKHQIYVRFEIPEERVEYEKDGKTVEGPITLGQFFTASMNEKANLRKQLEGWRGAKFTDEQAADFDVSKILGQACMLSVVESEAGGKTYSNIASISKLPKNFPVPAAENPLLFYDPEHTKDFDKLPEWLRKKIGEQIKPQAVEIEDFRDLDEFDRMERDPLDPPF